MQTFLPYPDFRRSARVLDYRRLGKQRLECKQLLQAIGHEIIALPSRPGYGQLRPCDSTRQGWRNHPAAKMWRGYHWSLADYSNVMIQEWISRGYNNTMLLVEIPQDARLIPPPWIGDEQFHASHRSNLLRKDPYHYGQFGWTEGPDMEYVWPVEGPGPTCAADF